MNTPTPPAADCSCAASDMPFGRCCKAPALKKTDQWDSCRVADYNQGWNDCVAALAAPPVPLTDEQIKLLPVWTRFIGLWPDARKEIVRAIEAAHGITPPKEQA